MPQPGVNTTLNPLISPIAAKSLPKGAACRRSLFRFSRKETVANEA
jgi:hypothetical protein